MNTSQDSSIRELTADVVIIGGGCMGMAAAATVAGQGLKVVVVEKGAVGGTGGVGLFAADSPTQRRLRLDVSRDETFKVAMEYSHWRINPRIYRAFINKSGDTIGWLESKGLYFSDCRFRRYHHETFHSLGDGKPAGPEIVRVLTEECRDIGVQLFFKCRAKKILTDEKGQLTGVLAKMEGTGGEEIKVKTAAVVIASGGYGGSKELLKKYYPAYDENLRYIGRGLNTGDGLKMAMDIGAATEGLGILMLHPMLVPGSRLLYAFSHEPATVWVNKYGERFADEMLSFRSPECGNAGDRQPDRIVYVLSDKRLNEKIMAEGFIRDQRPGETHTLEELEKELKTQADKGEVKIADSWDGIAEWIGASPEVLKATIDEYNSGCDRSYDAAFLKDRRFLEALNTPPFYAIRSYPCFLTTMGGIKINHHMEVLDSQNKPIGGLYAGGDAAGGWESDTYCMILPGSALGFAVNSGRIAGESAAKYVLTQS